MVRREGPQANTRNPATGRRLAGMARRYGVNPLVMRVLGVMTALIVSPIPYIALWVLMPRDD